jgi:CO/xanthine dehydrogenase Mo-binding subunit
MAASDFAEPEVIAEKGRSVGARIQRVDGLPKVSGTDVFGSDEVPGDSLMLRVIRSPYPRARFRFGDLDAYSKIHPGITRVFTASDIPGENRFGVIPNFRDQPVFAEEETRFRGEAVAAVVGQAEAVANLDLKDFPVTWSELEAVLSPAEARADRAPRLHSARDGNVLTGGLVTRGQLESGFAESDVIAEGEFETGFIEHAYIEPEAGFARRVQDRIEIQACTQAAYMDRDSIAQVLGLDEQDVRIITTAVGGGFGSKLDLSVQPYIALAAWHLNQPVFMTYSRPESIRSTTKRHPSNIKCKVAATKDGKLSAMQFEAVFNTGAYASWGPTVADRVPVHASGPYFVPAYDARSLAVHTNCPPSGAFRGFGVPQSAIAQESLFDELAELLGIDRLEFRVQNALENGMATGTGQVFKSGVGFKKCLRALKPHWDRLCAASAAFNKKKIASCRRGVGVAGVWYGCGNTSMPNPSTIKVGVRRDGRVVLFQGAADIGQGSNTVITQICADAAGIDIAHFELVQGDTCRTPDAGKTSASRQTFVSGKAAYLAGTELRRQILQAAGAPDNAELILEKRQITIRNADADFKLHLSELLVDDDDFVFTAEGTYDPPTSPLDENGQGAPYAQFGYGAHLVEVEVDTEIGTVKVRNVVAAHDVGRAINPVLIEGQVEGGVAQGIGMALMEDFIPGVSENLHDYLIPTIGDVPDVETIIIEEPDSHGPFGAKGLGEHVMVPTAPAILNAIYHATGARIRKVPATPDRVLKAIRSV